MNYHDQYDKTNIIPYALMATISEDHHGLRPAKYEAKRHRQESNHYSNPEVKFKNVPTGARPTPLA